MISPFLLKRRRDAQTLVFFLLSFGTIILLCGLAIDSGLLYLAKAQLSRAVDGAALVAVGNFNESPNEVANNMRSFAAANFTSLESTSTNALTSSNTVTTAAGTTTTLTYWYNDTTAGSDSKGYRKYVEVILTTGSGGQITSATCNARCPARTYFIGFAKGAFPILGDLNVSSAAVATRNPRLIMIVLDRSASMLAPPNDNGSYGAFGLPQSVVTFLDFFEPGADYIGIVSFGSNARLEMAPTTNFLYAATNNLIDSYSYATSTAVATVEGYYGEYYGVPGIDPEMTNAATEAAYPTTGVRRMKFGGTTAADDGMRMALECMMSNSGFNNPDVVKYLVLFTDGVWNNSRTLLAAPTYTNWMICDNPTASSTDQIVSNRAPNLDPLLTGSGSTGMVFMPSLSPMPNYTNALNALAFDTTNINYHTNDYFLSLDTNNGSGGSQQLEPLPGSTQNNDDGVAGVPASITNYTFLGTYNGTNTYTTTVNLWVQPGAVAYYHTDGSSTPSAAYIGDCNNPTNTITLQMAKNDQIELVVPGYIVDGFFYDGLDLPYVSPSPPDGSSENWYGYRWDNYNEAFMWPDDQTPNPTTSDLNNAPFWFDPSPVRSSFMRSLLFRNYANQLTGFYVFRADDPLGTGVEPLDSSSTWPTGSPRALNALGPYYPSAGFYWPFDLVGLDWDPANALTNALIDPDATGNGLDRNLAWSINMLSTNAEPEWAGQLFYTETGTNWQQSATNAASRVMTSVSDWTQGAPGWISAYTTNMTSDTANAILAASVSNATSPSPPLNWRPNTFRGTLIGSDSSGASGIINALSVLPSLPASATGGYLYDSSTGNVYSNTMCWNGRPTHYYNFATSTWVSVQDNHHTDIQALPLGYWKAQEYAWHARAAGVTIYTVGYGAVVPNNECLVLAQIANATNVEYTNSTASNPYIASQPVGVQYYATNTTDISNDFYQIGTAINAALTQ